MFQEHVTGGLVRIISSEWEDQALPAKKYKCNDFLDMLAEKEVNNDKQPRADGKVIM